MPWWKLINDEYHEAQPIRHAHHFEVDVSELAEQAHHAQELRDAQVGVGDY